MWRKPGPSRGIRSMLQPVMGRSSFMPRPMGPRPPPPTPAHHHDPHKVRESLDVGAWLRGLGLGQYEPAFRDNEAAADVLPRLTADDLKEIGVAAVGHRRKLLDAIARLGEPAKP